MYCSNEVEIVGNAKHTGLKKLLGLTEMLKFTELERLRMEPQPQAVEFVDLNLHTLPFSTKNNFHSSLSFTCREAGV